jgi:hypothetical protein
MFGGVVYKVALSPTSQFRHSKAVFVLVMKCLMQNFVLKTWTRACIWLDMISVRYTTSRYSNAPNQYSDLGWIWLFSLHYDSGLYIVKHREISQLLTKYCEIFGIRLELDHITFFRLQQRSTRHMWLNFLQRDTISAQFALYNLI